MNNTSALAAPASPTRRAAGSPDTQSIGLKELFRLLGLPSITVEEEGRFLRRRIKAGQWVFAAGEPMSAIHAVFVGSLKSVVVDDAGNEQILGFPHRGDLLGMDGLFSGTHASNAIALTDCELVVIRLEDIARLGDAGRTLETWLFRATSRELAREHELVGLLGTLSAEERIARFLTSLSDRFAAAGYSPRKFHLSMTRRDIGSYLGLTLETASRTFSALDAAGLIKIDQREVEILEPEKLRKLERHGVSRPARSQSVPHRPPAFRPDTPWSGLASAG